MSLPSTAAALALLASPCMLPLGHADVSTFGPELRVTPSSAETFVARGTLPLPEGWALTPGCPFGLRREGVVYPAQWWPVALHPDGTVAVAEIAATVPGITPLAPDPDPVSYQVVVSDPPYGIKPPTLDQELVALLTVPGQLRLRVDDSLGSRFEANLGAPLGSAQSAVDVVGRAKAVYAVDDLLYKQFGMATDLSYLGGFKAWYTLYDGGRTVELDLRWHNAVTFPGGDMVPDVIFEHVDLILPAGWTATPRWPMPTAGQPQEVIEGGQPVTRMRLIEDGATPHLLRQRGNLTWRLVLHRPGDEDEVADVLDRRGWGTVRGDQGGWQDPAASAWLANHFTAPDLSPWEASLEAELQDDRAAMEHAFETGEPYWYTGGLGALGPYHTYGVSYGGMTSGTEIYQCHGTDILWTAENDGLVAAEMRHRMVLDRQFGWFYRPDGALVTAFDLEQPDGSLPINVFNNEFVDVDENGAMGFETASDIYAGVQPRPTYETVMLGTNPYDGVEQHDTQHAIRATYPLKTLVWAANDRMARHDLIAQSALWHIQFHDGPGGRLYNLAQWSDAHPHTGGEFGRGEAWVLDAVATWYALGSAAEREVLNDWFVLAASTVFQLETPLDVFYGNRGGKITEYHEFDKQYAIIQWYEHAIAIAALGALRESWAPDPWSKATLEDLIVDGALAVWRTGWKPGTNGAWEQQAVAWMDPDVPAFASPTEIPADGTGGNADNDQIAAPLGIAGRYANGAEALEIIEVAKSLTGSSDALEGFENLTTYWLNLNNRAPLIAWLQTVAP